MKKNESAYFSYDGINENTYNLLFLDKESIDFSEDTQKNMIIYFNLIAFTLSRTRRILEEWKIKRKGYSCKEKISYDEEHQFYQYKDEDYHFNFLKLSDRIDEKKQKNIRVKKKIWNLSLGIF